MVIDSRKFTDYALNPDHRRGRHKALLFEQQLGFTRDNYQSLLQQIESLVLDAEAELGYTDRHGQRYRVYLEITGTEGQRVVVQTAWLVTHGSDEARLLTAYLPRRR